MSSLVNLETLYAACKNSYTRLHQGPESCMAIEGFKEVKYEFDEKTHHGAVSYYNEKTHELIVAHRGSATLHDWMSTDVKIALKAKQTPADLAAVEYTHRLINEMRQKRQPISKIYITGHSKGGHEAQVSAVNLIKGIPYSCVTINAPGINPKIKKPGVEYNHVNFRVTSLMLGDVVSLAGGKPLGHTANLQLGTNNFAIACHTLDAVKKAMDNNKELATMPVDEVIKATRVNLSLTVPAPKPQAPAEGSANVPKNDGAMVANGEANQEATSKKKSGFRAF